MVTVDCGITDMEEVKWAVKAGMNVIITDHHTPPSAVPPAMAIVNPKLAHSSYPFVELAGVGVAYKLLQALFRSIGRDEELDGMTDLVAIGTVADVMPLLGENRYLVRQGLKQINTNPRLGVKEIITQAGSNIGNLGADSITWCLAPWLNASGRLEHAVLSYKLLMTDSPQEAHDLAVLLGQKNVERQRLTGEVLAEARKQVLAQGISHILIASSENYPLGVAGPVGTFSSLPARARAR